MAEITAAQFIALLDRAQATDLPADATDSHLSGEGSGLHVRIPTGPWDTVDLNHLKDVDLVVADSVDLRGRKLDRPMFAHGVRFRGRVDLRDMTVRGSVDLTACVFDEELLLDDSEIEGSLRLARCSASRLSLNSIVVKGSLDLNGCHSEASIVLFDSTVEGFIDLRSVASPAVHMKGTRVRSDLRIGQAPEAGIGTSLQLIDASNTIIDGRISVEGAGQDPSRVTAEIRQGLTAEQAEDALLWTDTTIAKAVGLDLSLAHAKVGGNFQVIAFSGQKSLYDFSSERYAHTTTPNSPIAWSILGRLNLTGAHMAGDVTLSGTLVLDGIEAARVQIDGKLSLITGELLVRPNQPASRDCDWYCRQTLIKGELNMESARIKGTVFVSGTQICGQLALSSAVLGSLVSLSGYTLRTDQDAAHEVVIPTKIDGDLDLYLSELHNAAHFFGVHVGGSLNMWSTHSRAYVRLEPYRNLPCRIDDEIDLHSATMRQFDLRGVTVGGRVRLDGCNMLRFWARPGQLLAPRSGRQDHDDAAPTSQWHTNDAIVFTQVGHLRMRNGCITGDLGLEYMQLTGRECDGQRGLLIEDSKIGGNLQMFGESAILDTLADHHTSYAEARARCPVDHRSLSASVIGGIVLKRSQVGAAVDMSGVKVDGLIDLEDSQFGGDLRFSALRCDVHHPPEAHGRGTSPTHGRNLAICEGVNLRMAKCTNDVDLTGLMVVRIQGREAETGMIDGRYATVAGDLICFDDRHGQPALTRIEGHMDLSYAQLAHLVVSGCMFGSGSANGTRPPAAKQGLLLERAKVGKLDVRQATCPDDCAPRRAPELGSLAYPTPICLTDVQIEVWEIEGTADRDNDEERKYIHFLANDRPFRRSTYRALENSLRNRGDDEHADALYCAMRDREWQESQEHARRSAGDNKASVASKWLRATTQPFGFVAHHAYRMLLQYGTSSKSLFALVFILILLALPAYRTADNFEASLSYLTVPSNHFQPLDSPPLYNTGPTEQNWGWADALQMALKNHVPIVPLQVRDDWQPRDQGQTVWSMGQGHCSAKLAPTPWTVCLPIAPEDLFNVLQLLNWICWPIMLTFSIRRLLRQA